MVQNWYFNSRKLTLVVSCVGLAMLIYVFNTSTLQLPGYVIHNMETNAIERTRKLEYGVNNSETSINQTTRKLDYGIKNLETSGIQTIGNTRTTDNCNASLLLPQSENIKRISSYNLPEYEEYIQELFPSSMSSDIPDTPLFITGISSNHFQEGRALIDNFNKVIKVRYPHFRLQVYDIGLLPKEVSQAKLECNCTVERFKLENYPTHDRILKGYGWKPLLIQYTAKQYRFVIWLDACIRFQTSDIDSLLQKIRSNGIVVARGSGSIADRTLKQTFDILHEQPCEFEKVPEVPTFFVAIYETDYVKDYIMKPWVRCALFRGCLVSNENVADVHPCTRPGKYHSCHRFDQSALGLILHRLNHANIEDNTVNDNIIFKCLRGSSL